MFSLNNETCKLISVKPGAADIREEHTLDADMIIELQCGNDTLSEFHPSLKALLFRAADANDGSADLFQGVAGYLPKLRFPQIGSIKWESGAVKGYTAVLHRGMSGKNDIQLDGCCIDKFTFTPQDGGAVTIGFRLITHPRPGDMGTLCEFIKHKIQLSLFPPSRNDLLEIDGDD